MENTKNNFFTEAFLKVFGLQQLKNLFFVTKYKKLLKHELRRWIFIGGYIILYFSLEAYTTANNIKFAVWDTMLTTSILVLVVIFGNLFCGWFCFMSRFQDAIDSAGRFIFRSKYNNLISSATRNKLKWIKYIVFVLTITIPLIKMSYDYFIWMWEIFFSIGMFLCLFDSHAYCKYCCFIGALFSLGGLRNKLTLSRDLNACIDCNICSDVCTQDCNPARKITPINRDLWCTSCFRCKAVCPKNAITYK